MKFFKKQLPPDYVFIVFLIILVVFGLVMLASASSDLAKERFGDSYYYLWHQITYGLSLGILGFLIGAFVPYRVWDRLALPLLVLSIVLLSIVFIPALGVMQKGAERWVDFFGFAFQPSEAVKFTFLTYLSSWMSRNQLRRHSMSQGFIPFLVLIGIATILLILQPSTSTAIMLSASALIMYFTAGARIRFLALFGLLACLSMALLVYFTPYRLQRVLTYLHPQANPLTHGYQVNQSLFAIGSGGLTGIGYGQSTTKLGFLPEPIGDSIFAVIAEELGFIGSLGFVIFFLLFILRGFAIAKHTRDLFGRFLVTSFVSLFGLQAFTNIGAVSGLIPFTGVPLPFVSYGGTALVVSLTMCGVIVNISRTTKLS